jgi:hypothetical protein
MDSVEIAVRWKKSSRVETAKSVARMALSRLASEYDWSSMSLRKLA